MDTILQWIWNNGFQAGFNRAVRLFRKQELCKKCKDKFDKEPCFERVLD